MKVSVAQLGPPAVALAVVGLCAYPHLMPAAPAAADAAASEKIPEIAAAFLAPRLGKTPARDPFKAPGEPQPDMLALANLKPAGTPSKGTAKPDPPADPARRDRPTAPADPAARGPEAAPKPARDAEKDSNKDRDKDRDIEPQQLLGGLVLNATIVQPLRRFAMIDGKVYQEGDVLRVPGVGPARLLRIEHNRALFVARGKPAELTFRAAGSATRPGAAGPALAGGPRPSPSRARAPGGAAADDLAAMLLRVMQQPGALQGAGAEGPGGGLP